MERSLHHQLKRLAARDAASVEVRIGSYRIDAIDLDGNLVEVQCAPLAAIRDKVLAVRELYDVRIIKPIVAAKTLEVLDSPGGSLLRKRRSPKRASKLDIFGELLHFTRCFPHPRVALEFWLVEVIETRLDRPKLGRQKPYKTVDVRLGAINERISVLKATDLLALLPSVAGYREPFCTQRLALDAGVERWQAQQMAFVLERCGGIEQVGKRGNSRLYRLAEAATPATKPLRRERRGRKTA